jgi:uncharacterized protein
MLRGVAVLGILVMNIYAFAMSAVAYSNPIVSGGTEWYNLATWYFTHLFFDQKFMTIFSMLFGAGLVMMSTRAETRGDDYTGTWFRRMFWLLVIGAAHAYLLWFGDILFVYALAGMLIFAFRYASTPTLVWTACALLAVGMMLSYAGGAMLSELRTTGPEVVAMDEAGETLDESQQAILEAWERSSMFMQPPEAQLAEDTAAYTGRYGEIVEYRAPLVARMQSQAVFGAAFWRIVGLMLLGMAIMRRGILSAERDPAFYRLMMGAGYGIGLPLIGLGAWNIAAHDFDLVWLLKIGSFPNYIGSILVAFGHIGLVMTIIQRAAFPGLMTRFAAVGRMAFTNYLMHSLILTTVFYGYGFGLYGQVPRLQQMAIVVAVIGFQLWLSPWWLARFRFGPAEWLWRSLTYLRLQPMRAEGAHSRTIDS